MIQSPTRKEWECPNCSIVLTLVNKKATCPKCNWKVQYSFKHKG